MFVRIAFFWMLEAPNLLLNASEDYSWGIKGDIQGCAPESKGIYAQYRLVKSENLKKVVLIVPY